MNAVDEMVMAPFILVIFRVPLRVIPRSWLISCWNWELRFPFRYPVSVFLLPPPPPPVKAQSEAGLYGYFYLSENHLQLWLLDLVPAVSPEQ
jgi:hypothetical protein